MGDITADMTMEQKKKKVSRGRQEGQKDSLTVNTINIQLHDGNQSVSPYVRFGIDVKELHT